MKRSVIENRLQKLFETSPVVVWDDPAGEFADNLADLDLPGATVFVDRDGERFELKALVNGLAATDRLLIYRATPEGAVSPATDTSADWLADVMSYAPIFTADAASTQLADLNALDTPEMRAALKQFAPFFKRASGVKRVHELRASFSTPNELALAVITAALGSDTPATADWTLIAFMACAHEQGSVDAQDKLERAGAWGAFCRMTRDYVGFAGDASKEDELSVHVLMSALHAVAPHGLAERDSGACLARGGDCGALGLESDVPAVLAAEHGAPSPAASEQTARHASEVLRLWLSIAHGAGTVHDALLHAAQTAEHAYGLPAWFGSWPTDSLAQIAAFPAVDETLIKRALRALAANERVDENLRTALDQRRTSVWHDRFAATYAALAAALDIEVFGQLSSIDSDARVVWNTYTTSWFRMDAAYRKFRLAFRTARNEVPSLDKDLHRLADHIETRYRRDFLRDSAAAWEHAAEQDLATNGYVADIPRQRDFFITEVEPLLRKTKRTWVIISDALRFEVAAALGEELERTTQGQVHLASMQAGFPSITACGMAALLPHAKLRMTPHVAEPGRNPAGFDVFVDGLPTQGTPARQTVLQTYLDTYHPGMKGVALQSSAFMNMERAERKEAVGAASVVFLYHNRIDAIGDDATTEHDVFDACRDTSTELCQLVSQIVREFRASDILITADHGFLYTAQPLGETDKVALTEVQGQIAAYGRRYVVGMCGVSSDAMMPVSLTATSDGELQGLAPREMIRIKKAGGGENYVHGGISLQELCVPVLHFKNFRAGSKGFRDRSYATLSLVSPLTTITNASFELQLLQDDAVGGKVLSATYELGFYLDDGTPATEVCHVTASSAEPDAINRTNWASFHVRAAVMDHVGATCRLVARNVDDPSAEELVLARCTLSISVGTSFSSDW